MIYEIEYKEIVTRQITVIALSEELAKKELLDRTMVVGISIDEKSIFVKPTHTV